MEIKELDLKSLTAQELKVYEGLVPEEFRCYLYSKNPNNLILHYIALAAVENEKPLGLLLATATESFYIAKIHSLYVEETKEQLLISAHLMSYLEQELKKTSCIMIQMFYLSDSQDLMKPLLQKLHWMDPFPIASRYLFEGKIFQPSWLYKKYRYPADIFSLPWQTLSENEKKELLRQKNQSRFPAEISPFLNETDIEPLNSLVLKKNEEIIGWMITHRINPLTIRYSALYILPKYQFTSLSTKLLIDAIQIQKRAIDEGHPALYAEFDVKDTEEETNNWKNFIKRRLAPYAQKIRRIYQTWKDLSMERII